MEVLVIFHKYSIFILGISPTSTRKEDNVLFLVLQNCISVLVLGIPPKPFPTEIRRLKRSKNWPEAVQALRSPQRRGTPVPMHRSG
jgi:hypothetical protein